MDNANMPVTPIVGSNGRIQPFTDDQGFSSMATGLTKREAFVMAAIQGISVNFNDYTGADWSDDLASDAIRLADSALKGLAK